MLALGSPRGLDCISNQTQDHEISGRNPSYRKLVHYPLLREWPLFCLHMLGQKPPCQTQRPSPHYPQPSGPLAYHHGASSQTYPWGTLEKIPAMPVMV